MTDPRDWNEDIARAGRAALYGLLTPWNEDRHDYDPVMKAGPGRCEHALQGAMRAMDIHEQKLRREHLVAEMNRLGSTAGILA